MKMMTKAIEKKFEKHRLYSTEKGTWPKEVIVKYFAPWSNWRWYATEFDGKDLFFGFVEGFEKEWGYFSLSELKSIEPSPDTFYLAIERDRHFDNRVIYENGDIKIKKEKTKNDE
jgi:hypothetical protein